LNCYDALQGCNFNYPAVFGMPYIELPIEIIEDIRALRRREAQLQAGKE